MYYTDSLASVLKYTFIASIYLLFDYYGYPGIAIVLYIIGSLLTIIYIIDALTQKQIGDFFQGLRVLIFMIAFIFGYFDFKSIPGYCIWGFIIAFIIGAFADADKKKGNADISDADLQNLMMFNMMSRMNRSDDHHCNPHHSYNDCHDKSHHYQNYHEDHSHH